jgi:glycine/D-amino acid oxidase-like deaminating enzyme
VRRQPARSPGAAELRLHASLAEQIGGDWGYRRLATYGGFAGTQHGARRSGNVQADWLSDGVVLDRRLGSPATTAQVHPGQFTAAMMRAAEVLGAELRLGRVTGIVRRNGGDAARLAGVEVDGGETIEGDAVVIAMGPWSMLAAGWLPLPGVFGLKGHSLVLETGTRLKAAAFSAAAVFLECPEAVTGGAQSPELFPRPDGTTYVCAISSSSPLPADPAEVAPDPGAIERLQAMCRRLSPVLGQAKVLARQACHRPVTQDGLPLIGPVPGHEGAYVAAGHGVWGILNAPATGEAVAELIIDDVARSVDLSPFDPARLPPLDPMRLAPKQEMR